MGVGVPMAWVLRSVRLSDLGPKSTWNVGTSLELRPHSQSAAEALGRHSGGTVKSDPKVPLWPGQ